MYLCVRVGRSRVGGGLLFWLFAGPLILEFLMVYAMVRVLAAACASGSRELRRHRAAARRRRSATAR